MKTVKKILSLILSMMIAMTIIGCAGNKPADTPSDVSGDAVSDSSVSENPSDTEESSTPEESSKAEESSKVDSSKTDASTTSSKTTGSSKTDEAKKNLDFGGQTITIIYEYQPSSEYGIDASRDRELDRIKVLNKKYNVNIVMKKGASNYNESIISSVSAGKPVGNIIRINGNRNYDFIKAGLCADLSDAMTKTGIDMSAAHYDQRTNKYYNVNNKQYVMSYIVPQETLVQDMWYYNKDVLAELGYGANYINELYEQGKWNWDQVSELARKATKTAANGTVTRYGIGFRTHYKAITSMVLNNGGSIGTVDSNGNPKVNLSDLKVRTAFQQAYQWGSVDKVLALTEATESDSKFTKGEIFMYCTTASAAKNFYSNGVNCGAIYPPVGPNASSSKVMVQVGGSFIIPVTYQNDADKYLMLMDDLYGEYEDASREEIFKQDYIHLFGDEYSWNVVKNATLNTSMHTNDDFTAFNLEWTTPAFSTVCQNLVKGGITGGRLAETYNDQYQALLDELFKGYALTGVNK